YALAAFYFESTELARWSFPVAACWSFPACWSLPARWSGSKRPLAVAARQRCGHGASLDLGRRQAERIEIPARDCGSPTHNQADAERGCTRRLGGYPDAPDPPPPR